MSTRFIFKCGILSIVFALSATLLAVEAVPIETSKQDPSNPPAIMVAGQHKQAALADGRRGRRGPRVRRNRGNVRPRVRYNGYLGPRAAFFPGAYWGPWGPWGGFGPTFHYGIRRSPDMGAIDINVYPKKAKVYLNGHLIGKASKFDGFPGHLWLRRGKHELIYHLDGYETVRKVYHVTAGAILRERMDLVNGQATLPAELSKPPEQSTYARRPERTHHARDDREGVPERRYYRRDHRPDREPRSDTRSEAIVDARPEPARLKLDIVPGNASIYIDGRFISTARELARNGGALTLDPGQHRVDVVLPGHVDSRVDIDLKPGQQEALTIDLRKQ